MAFQPHIPTQFDHLIYAVPDLDRGIDAVEQLLGVRPMIGGRHEAFGTRNALLSLGDSNYFELIAPDLDVAVAPHPRILGLDDVDAPRLVSWVAQSSDIDLYVATARARGAELGDVLSGSRTRPDGSSVTWKCTDPRAVSTPGILPFVLDWGATPTPALSAPRGCSLVSFRAEHPRPAQMHTELERLEIELDVAKGESPALIAVLDTPRGHVELR